MKKIFKLEELVKELGFNYTLKTLLDGLYKLSIYDKEGTYLDDVIIHSWSHGHEEGLFETYYSNDFQEYETAEEIANGWYEKYLAD